MEQAGAPKLKLRDWSKSTGEGGGEGGWAGVF